MLLHGGIANFDKMFILPKPYMFCLGLQQMKFLQNNIQEEQIPTIGLSRFLVGIGI